VPTSVLQRRIEHHLRVLVEDIGARPPGSPANRRATEHVRRALTDAGLRVSTFPFVTRWWEPGPGRLTVPSGTVDVAPNPYSPRCDVTGRVVRVATLAELCSLGTASGTIVVLVGDLGRDPVMPKRFPFSNPAEHQRLVAALEAAAPAAVVAVSEQWQPIFEDADLAFPSTTVPPTLGGSLTGGTQVRLELGGVVHEGPGATVSGRTPGEDPRIVVSAHLDSKATTPGAFDNAGGVAIVLALAELGLPNALPVELVLFNGEDHFDACGELAWLAANDLGEVVADINVDGVGLAGRGTSLAALGCPPALEASLAAFVARHPGWSRAEPWMESDHAIFAMRGVPAVAVTSDDVHALLAGIAHGPQDTLEAVDLATLAQVAFDLVGLVTLVGRARQPAPH
jgi:aminopeptidase YwaD